MSLCNTTVKFRNFYEHSLANFDPRGPRTTVPAGSDHYFHTCCPSVRPAQNFKIQRQSLPAGTVGWPSGSLMTPVLYGFVSFATLT